MSGRDKASPEALLIPHFEKAEDKQLPPLCFAFHLHAGEFRGTSQALRPRKAKMLSGRHDPSLIALPRRPIKRDRDFRRYSKSLPAG
jgi:hypothetical protein